MCASRPLWIYLPSLSPLGLHFLFSGSCQSTFFFFLRVLNSYNSTNLPRTRPFSGIESVCTSNDYGSSIFFINCTRFLPIGLITPLWFPPAGPYIIIFIWRFVPSQVGSHFTQIVFVRRTVKVTVTFLPILFFDYLSFFFLRLSHTQLSPPYTSYHVNRSDPDDRTPYHHLKKMSRRRLVVLSGPSTQTVIVLDGT